MKKIFFKLTLIPLGLLICTVSNASYSNATSLTTSDVYYKPGIAVNEIHDSSPGLKDLDSNSEPNPSGGGSSEGNGGVVGNRTSSSRSSSSTRTGTSSSRSSSSTRYSSSDGR